eukprot:CAMPEP_0117448814 /NCGR_PEP_ID=MMETSP0759-20121206/7605_1 /TAXON_ID=63605 /ORGANISM="Percolomonas cosmopolitus, Strain WS" /LENGTH=690 /DNA_ID=CAMNT_0005241233 /DNA_START=293 /DNA_END=2362 /DNA_ORIENTATION=-
MTSNTPSPPRRLSDDDPDMPQEENDDHSPEMNVNNEDSVSDELSPVVEKRIVKTELNGSVTPEDRKLELREQSPPGRSFSPLKNRVKKESSSSNATSDRASSRTPDSPSRVLSPSEDRPSFPSHQRRQPYKSYTTRSAGFAKKYPTVQDQTQLKALLNSPNRALLSRFIKMRLQKNEELQIDFLQYLEQNVDAMPDSELYLKLREYIFDHGYTYDTLDTRQNRFNSRVQDILSVLPNRNYEPEIALDVGCADGSITASLRDQISSVGRVVGVDVRDVRTERTTDKFEFVLLDENDTFKVESLENESVDLVVCMMSLHHIKNIDATLDELRRVMKKGAFLVIREHDCFKDEARLFLDVVHGMYGLVFTEPMEDENFCETYKATYRSKRDWENLLEKKRFFAFKDTTPTGLFSSYIASFKKDVARGASSRKRSHSAMMPHGGMPYGGGPPPMGGGPPGMGPYGGAPGFFGGAPQGGPPMKRRRFNSAPQGFHQGPPGATPMGRGAGGAYFGGSQQQEPQQQSQQQPQRGGRQGGNRRGFHGGPAGGGGAMGRGASPFQQQQPPQQQQQQPYQQTQGYYSQQGQGNNQWNGGGWNGQQQAQWNGYAAGGWNGQQAQQQQMQQQTYGNSRGGPAGDFRGNQQYNQQRGGGRQQYNNSNGSSYDQQQGDGFGTQQGGAYFGGAQGYNQQQSNYQQ